MRKTLNTLSDRVLGAFLPKTKVGACPCQPGEGGRWEYRCYNGQLNQRRHCYYNCQCKWTCGSWITIGDC